MILPVSLTALFGASAVLIAASGAPPLPPNPPQPAAIFGVDVVDVPDAYPHRAGVSGVYVIRVAPNSPAEAAHVLPGDIVAQIRGASVNNLAGYDTLTAPLTPGTAVPLNVRRYGRNLTLNVTPAAPEAVYPKTPLCSPDATAAELGAADVSARRHDFENERVHGGKALNMAMLCASLQQKTDGQSLIDAGDAFAALGMAAAAQTERDAANALFGSAWISYHLGGTLPGVNSDMKHAASAKAASLEKRVAGVRTNNDPAIALGLAYVGGGLGATPFSIVDSWHTDGEGYSRIVHLRVKITAARDALLFANGFRVTTPSVDAGDEVFFALDTPAPASTRVRVPSDKARADIDPAEDLGALGHAFVKRGIASTYVLTFLIGDRQADITNIGSTLAYLPQ